MTATFSPCRQYRYTLWRDLGDMVSMGTGYVMFIGLNPSTADETSNDPTINRCINFTKRWGYTRLCMTNLFAYRATDPGVMMAQEDPVGPDNDQTLLDMAANASLIVAAWGTHGHFMHRDAEVRQKISGLHCIRLTKNGCPEHPLYLPGHLTPVPFT